MGRLLEPGGIVRMKGSMQSYQVSTRRSDADVTVSTAVERGSTAREKAAVRTGRSVSAKAGKRNVSIVRCSHRVDRHAVAVDPDLVVDQRLCMKRTWPALPDTTGLASD